MIFIFLDTLKNQPMKNNILLFCIILYILPLHAHSHNEYVSVFGTELIQTKVCQYRNVENGILSYISRILSEAYRLKPVKIEQLQVFLQDNYINEQDAVEFLKKTTPAFKYAVFYNAKTSLITDFGYMNIPPAVESEIALSVYDLATGEAYHVSSNTGAIFSPDSLCEQDIINVSKMALRYLTNEKNPENCFILLQSIFVNL